MYIDAMLKSVTFIQNRKAFTLLQILEFTLRQTRSYSSPTPAIPFPDISALNVTAI